MMKCSFCEQPLACKACKQPFQARGDAAHTAVYQPDMQIHCPHCDKILVCRHCGFVYGEDEDTDEA
jgi:hypothetical protein